MEIVFVLAVITGRTLVLPASFSMYLLNKKKNNGVPMARSFGDFFPLDKIRRRGVPIISMHEFLLAQEGNLLPSPLSSSFRLDDTNETIVVNRTTLLESALHCENRKRADYSCYGLYELLNRVGYNPNVTDEKCVMFDEQAYGSGNNNNNSNKNEPSAKAQEMVAQICGNRPVVYWSRDISSQHQLLYLPAMEQKYRLLTHFYGLLHFSNATVDNYTKRFVRDNLHYHDEIYCAAGKIVQALQEEGRRRRRGNEARNSSGEEEFSYYSALHIRRGDLQFKEVKIPASEWYENTKELWRENEILYVATDERNKTFFDDLAQHYELRFLDDYWNMAGLDQLDPDYMGMVDTIVASRGRLFCGTWYSTFSGYINRLRGYHGLSMKDSWYSFLPRKTALHEWAIVNKSAYAFEWPDGWIGIDGDSFPAHDVF
jgi:GDP-fucose protein O-fucosyltransferase